MNRDSYLRQCCGAVFLSGSVSDNSISAVLILDLIYFEHEKFDQTKSALILPFCIAKDPDSCYGLLSLSIKVQVRTNTKSLSI
jgi:hypothetical protein